MYGAPNGAREPEVEEPLFAAKWVVLEFEVEDVAEPKAVRSNQLQKLVQHHGSFIKAAREIKVSESFIRQNVR